MPDKKDGYNTPQKEGATYSTSKNKSSDTFKSGFMEPEKGQNEVLSSANSPPRSYGYGHSSTKRGTSSDAFEDLKKAKDRELVGAMGDGDKKSNETGRDEITSEGQSLIWALIAGLVGVISFELVFTSKGGFKGRVNADVRNK